MKTTVILVAFLMVLGGCKQAVTPDTAQNNPGNISLPATFTGTGHKYDASGNLKSGKELSYRWVFTSLDSILIGNQYRIMDGKTIDSATYAGRSKNIPVNTTYWCERLIDTIKFNSDKSTFTITDWSFDMTVHPPDTSKYVITCNRQ
jgi:hypothetical protein